MMETIYYTYQDFYAHTKGVSYLLMVAALIGIALFWKFLSAKDDKKTAQVARLTKES